MRRGLWLLLLMHVVLVGTALVWGRSLSDRLLPALLSLFQAVPIALGIRWAKGGRATKGFQVEDLRPGEIAAVFGFACAGILDLILLAAPAAALAGGSGHPGPEVAALLLTGAFDADRPLITLLRLGT